MLTFAVMSVTDPNTRRTGRSYDRLGAAGSGCFSWSVIRWLG
jgi:hypothetical protein